MNIRPLESLTKEELIELIRHERDHSEQPLTMAPEGWKLAPVDPTYDMTQAGVNLALSARISGAYPWPTYIRDIYKAMLAAAPQPDHIPDATKMVEPTDAEMLDLLIEMRRELHACQAVINLAGFNTPSAASAALAAINKADIVIKAMRGEK